MCCASKTHARGDSRQRAVATPKSVEVRRIVSRVRMIILRSHRVMPGWNRVLENLKASKTNGSKLPWKEILRRETKYNKPTGKRYNGIIQKQVDELDR
jgi:hypothetical protein